MQNSILIYFCLYYTLIQYYLLMPKACDRKIKNAVQIIKKILYYFLNIIFVLHTHYTVINKSYYTH